MTTPAPQNAPAAKPEPGSPEHEAAMVAKFDTANENAQRMALGTAYKAPEQPAPTKPQRPAEVPEKFWNAEKGEVDYIAMAKSYAELERKQGAPKEPESKPAPTQPAGPDLAALSKATSDAAAAAEAAKKAAEAKPEDAALKTAAEEAAKKAADAKAAEDAAKASANDAAKQLADRGLDFNAFSDEFARTGKLSDESYAKLEKGGIPRQVADAYIAGQMALAEKRTAEGQALVGGKDAYDAMVKWAAVNMTPAERDAYNAAVAGTPEQMQLAISGLHAKYKAAVGSDPKLLQGGNTAPADNVGFTSKSQMTAAIRDPRYTKDPAYRAEVERKIANANFSR